MELNLEKALEGPVDISHRFVLDLTHLERPELVSLEPVSFDGRLIKAELDFILAGTLKCMGVVACARCLMPVDFSSEKEVTWVFTPAPDAAKCAEVEFELARNDFDAVFFRETRFPFDPLIEEEVQLEIPLKSLCREDCKGLCAQCGTELNTANCSCKPVTDARWEALSGLVKPGN